MAEAGEGPGSTSAGGGSTGSPSSEASGLAGMTGANPSPQPASNTPPQGSGGEDPGSKPQSRPGSDPDRPAWAPEQFWDATAKGVRTEQLANGFTETKAELTRTQQKLAELEKARGSIPEKPDEYHELMDWTALEQAAPNAFKRHGKDSAVVKALLNSAHAGGMTREKAHAQLTEIWKAFDSTAAAEAVKPLGERINASVEALGPTGKAVSDRVAAYLTDRTSRGLVTEAEKQAMLELASTPDGLRLAAKLVDSGTPSGPPVANGVGHVDVMREAQEVEKLLGSKEAMSGPKRAEAYARWRTIQPNARRDLSAGFEGEDPFPG